MQFRNRHFFIQQSFITHTTPLKVLSSWLVLSDCVFWTTSIICFQVSYSRSVSSLLPFVLVLLEYCLLGAIFSKNS